MAGAGTKPRTRRIADGVATHSQTHHAAALRSPSRFHLGETGWEVMSALPWAPQDG